MKIAVYTIALNEEKHVKRWFESAKDADLLLIADTGSTDKTRFNAKSMGVVVHEISVVPWRFDVARNASLALIPEEFDICIQLDMDEILPLGWRKKVEEAFLAGNNWPIYKHVTSRNPDGRPKTYQHYFKIHPRKGFIWKYPIHEVLVAQPGVTFKRELIDLEVDHIQDHSKSRKSYLNLLEMAVNEDPSDWRMRHYHNREYWYNKDWNKVLSSAYEAMEITNGWDVERSSTCMWASEAAHNLNLKKLSIEWAERATSEAPNFYEAWHWRAHIAHLNEDWVSCREFSFKRLELKRQEHHLVKPEVWEWWGYDLMALSSHKLGFHEDAVFYGKTSLNLAPYIDRLSRNLEFYIEAKNNYLGSQNYSINASNPISFLRGDFIKVLDTYFLPFTRWDYMSEKMLQAGLWDLDLTNWMIRNVKAGWVCLNVGSNSGYFLELLSRLSGKNGKVVGFEPNKELVARYSEARKLNNYSDCADIEVNRVAVGNFSGEITLSIPKGNLGGANISGDVGSSLTGFVFPSQDTLLVRAPIVPLHEIVDYPVDFILMDVEGSEEGVFQSFDDNLKSTPLLVIETGSYHSLEFLKKLDDEYKIEDLFGNAVNINSISNMKQGVNINILLRKKMDDDF